MHVYARNVDIGAAYGTAKSGVGIASMGVMKPKLVMRNIIPVIMAGVLGIYGLIVAVILQGSITSPQDKDGVYSTTFASYAGYASLAAGAFVIHALMCVRAACSLVPVVTLLLVVCGVGGWVQDSAVVSVASQLAWPLASLVTQVCARLDSRRASSLVRWLAVTLLHPLVMQHVEGLWLICCPVDPKWVCVCSGVILILIFAEALGLYGLIVALILSQQMSGVEC